MAKNGFVLRIAPDGEDKVSEALKNDQLIIGWAGAKDLLDPGLERKDFREIVHEEYYNKDGNLQRAGKAAGNLWRFIRVMEIGDLVVVPHKKSEFYVGEVEGDACYDETKVVEDSAYRRPVKWLNGKHAIPRARATSALAARLKTRWTCLEVTNLVTEIKDCLERAQAG